jgi:hypothetical protein
MTSPSPFRPGRRPFRAGIGSVHSGAEVIPGPPAAVEIPLCWFTQPLRLRMDKPYTTATVDQPNFGTAYDSSGAAQDSPFRATLQSITPGVAQNLATFTVTYRAEALTRCPELHLDLMHRTVAERVKLLRVRKNQRIHITGTPPEFPVGAEHLIVSGIVNEIGTQRRRIRWTTRPVIGTAPGVSGPWFYPGASTWGSSDAFIF